MRAAALKTYLANSRSVIHAELLSFTQEDGDDIVEFEIDIDLPQRPLHPIKAIERVRVRFRPEDRIPEVCVIRNDFPHVPHLTLTDIDYPRYLCLYQRSWADERESWAPRPFVERIRHWFSGTADGTLHPEDQPMEPVLLHSHGSVVLPKYDFAPGQICRVEHYYFSLRSGNYYSASSLPAGSGDKPVPVLFVQGPIVNHGIVHRNPSTLGELEQLITRLGMPITETIAKKLTEIQTGLNDVAQKPLLLVVELPKRRTPTGPVESCEHQAFLLAEKTAELLKEETVEEKIDALWVTRRRPLFLNPEKFSAIKLLPLTVRWHLQPKFAAAMNGYKESAIQIVSIGAGSLGSQVANHLWRSGFGRWTFVDDDILDAHNPARHLLASNAVGLNKAHALATALGSIYPEQAAPAWIDANYLAPAQKEREINEALTAAELILDFSASVAVGRHLARDHRSNGRRVSAFLNQRGDESVILSEDVARQNDLAWLEAEYMRAVAIDPKLKDHFDDARTVAHRYGNGCREVSAIIAQDAIALHAGLVAAGLRAAVATPSATVSVRRWSRTKGDVTVVNVHISMPRIVEINGWEVRLHPEVLSRLRSFRSKSLPNETGGILLGLVDRTLRMLTVIDLLPAPSDSTAWPTSFIRGSVGLKSEVARFTKRTLGNVLYVGEWHSHPKGCTAHPSKLDYTAVALCSPHAHAEGLPTLMLIVAENKFSVVLHSPGEKKMIAQLFDFDLTKSSL